MTISELSRTMKFVKQFVIDSQVLNRFQELIQILQQNAQAPRPGQMPQPQPITQQKSRLLELVRAISPEALTFNERSLLAVYIGLDLMGEPGVKQINSIFSEHNLDPMGAIQALSAILQKYQSLSAAATTTLNVLKPVDIGPAEPDIEEGRAVLQIAFKAKASISNVTELRDYADQWWQIIRSFGLLTDTTAEQAKILSFERGSIIIEISATCLLVKAIGMAADQILSTIDRGLNLKKTIAEIKHYDLTNKQIEKDLEKEADSFAENRGKEIGQKVIGEINKEKLADGEVMNAVQMSIKNLYVFLDHGGTVDCRLRHMKDDPQDSGLREVFEGIRKLETRIDELKLLTHDKPEKGPNAPPPA